MFLSVRPTCFVLPSSQPEPKPWLEQVSAGPQQETEKSDPNFVVELFFTILASVVPAATFFPLLPVLPNWGTVDFVWQSKTTDGLHCLGTKVCWNIPCKAVCAVRGAAHHAQLHPRFPFANKAM